jgi:hypothetical protein
MTTVIFVHGTGVREAAYADTLRLVERGLRPLRPDVTVAPCYWGTSAGAVLHAGGLSVPGYADGRAAPGAADDADTAVQLWGLLYLDPLLELRLATAVSRTARELPPGAPRPGELLVAVSRSLGADDRLRPTLEAAGIQADFGAAVAAVLAAPDARRFLRAATGAGESALLARAFTAEAVRRRTERDAVPPPLDGAARDAAVEQIVRLLPDADAAGEHRGPVARAAGRLAGPLALRLASAQAVKRRSALTDAAHPAAGDVLLYLARGAAVRQAVAEAIRGARPPVVLLAHSLGGIAALDLLVLEPGLPVGLLVTVGSQAPFLYELGALPSLEYGHPLPAHVPRWLNVYDRRDLLSYVGAGLFPGRVEDIALDGRQPFPVAHSAYWGNPELYRLLAAELP